jgi:amidase
MGPACSIDNIYGDRWEMFFTILQLQAAIHITVPCGKVYELPIGFSFFGTAYSEPELIGLAYAFEQASITELNLVSRNLFIETPSNKTTNKLNCVSCHVS